MSGTNAKTTSAAGFGSIIPSIEEKNKQIQQETMMEKLRAKYRNKPKTYEEIKKSVRMYFIEKHYPLDPLCKATLQSALDKLQHYIKVTSRHGLVERLESLSRQLGLKFMEDQQLLFISTDMFYVEILLDAKGNLSDVKVHHECKIEQQSSELVNCLKLGDFADFTVQLEGLSSIYQLNAEPKVKKKAFVALQAMETDIYNLYQMQNHNGDSYNIMSNSAVGLVLQRRGGHPMKLTYFCPPIHLPVGEYKSTSDFSIEQVIHSPNGLSATVNLEGSSANKLQIIPTVSFNRDAQTGLEVPTYAPLTQVNSMLMPATYVLRLNKPMPVCYEMLRAIGLPLLGEVGAGSGSSAETTPQTTVMNLIVQTASKNAIKNTQRGLYVNLPKETHCYFFTDNRKLQGTMISSLPFTEPAQVPKIIAFLKKQALFYTLLSSCVREQQKQYNDMDSTVILEVTAVSFNQITVELQHPYEESLATVDFLLEDYQVTCTIYCLSNSYESLSQKLTRTVRKVLSIPMVIYKLLKCWDEEHQQKLNGVIGAPGASGGGSTFGSSNSCVGGALPNGGNSSATSFGQFAMEASNAEGCGGFSSLNNLKMDNKVRSLADAFAASTSAAAAIAGLINLKRETDPQATSLAAAAALPIPNLELNLPAAQQSKASDIEIADKYKNIWKDKTPNLKHCVSITPITGDGKVLQTQPQQPQVVSEVQRTGGIEIIPLNAQAGTSNAATSSAAATTITITPITGKDGGKEKSKSSNSGGGGVGASTVAGSGVATKRPHDGGAGVTSGSSSSTSSTDTQKEKKRKKKRDDSPMGPPEKVYSRQNSPAACGDPSSASGVVRKFSSPSSSPKGGGSCASLMAGVPPGTSLATRPSPKHSPVYSSPKHNTASNSPKSPFGTHSPKHGSSGKPSMSTLKSATAATSLSPKGEKSCSSGASGTASGAASAAPSASNAALVRSFASVGAVPVPPLASAHPSMASSVKREKDKSTSSASSSMPASGVVNAAAAVVAGVSPAAAANVAAAVAAAAALKNSQQQQQLKSSVSSLSHLAAGGNLSAYAAAGHAAAGANAALELNALRKGMAGGAVSLMTSTAALAAQTTTTTTLGATMPQPAATPAAILAAAATLAAPTPAVVGAPAAAAAAMQMPQQPAAAPPSGANVGGVLGTSGGSDGGSGNGSKAMNPLPASTEYVVKPCSQEGLKLTINKTSNSGVGVGGGGGGGGNPSSKMKSSSSGSGSGSNSSAKKAHTGLKPGVNSGPASKKSTPLVAGKSVGSIGAASPSTSLSSSASSSTLSTKHVFQKANSSGNLSGKLGGGLPLIKSNSTNSFGAEHPPRRRPSVGGLASSSAQRKGLLSAANSSAVSPAALSGSMSQPPPRFDHHTDMMTILQYASPSMAASMEGFIKGLHNKFQIPKLSQRGSSTASGRSTPSTEPAPVPSALALTSQETSRPAEQAATQKPTPTADLLLANHASNAVAADGIDEELLASLAGE